MLHTTNKSHGGKPQGQHTVLPSARATAESRKRTALIAALAVFALLVLYGISLGLTARSALSEVESIAGHATNLASQVTGGDSAGAVQSARDISECAEHVEQSLSSPIVSIATIIPVVGPDLARVQRLSSVATDLTANALVPMTQRLTKDSFADIAEKDGSLNVKSLGKLLDSLEEAAPAVQRATDAFDNLGEANIEQLRKPLQTITQMMNLLNSFTSVAPSLSEAIPNFLGAQGKRSYLVLAQTNSEIRPTGGMPGAFGILTIDKGKISIGDFTSITGYLEDVKACDDATEKYIQKYTAPITNREAKLFGRRVGFEPRDTNFIADFPRVAEIEAQICENNNFGKPDGVIALDPTLVQDLLGVVGPITTSAGYEVNGNNAAQMILHDAYNLMSSHETDLFFAEVASQAFGKLKSNLSGSNLAGLVTMLASAMEDGRLLIWSKDKTEQAGLEALGADGSLSKDEQRPELGVFVGTGGSSKLSWYLDFSTTFSKVSENPDGSTTYSAQTTLLNTVSNYNVATDNQYILGFGGQQRQTGDMPLWIYLYAPAGGRISDVQASGHFPSAEEVRETIKFPQSPGEGMVETSYQNLDLWYGITQILPGQRTVLTYTVTTSPNARADLTLRATPTVRGYLKGKRE